MSLSSSTTSSGTLVKTEAILSSFSDLSFDSTSTFAFARVVGARGRAPGVPLPSLEVAFFFILLLWVPAVSMRRDPSLTPTPVKSFVMDRGLMSVAFTLFLIWKFSKPWTMSQILVSRVLCFNGPLSFPTQRFLSIWSIILLCSSVNS